MSFMDIIYKILEVIQSFFDNKKKKTEIELQEKKEKEEKKIQEALKEDDLEKQKKEASDAAYEGNVDKINEILNSSVLILLSFSFLFCGCTTKKVIYVPTDRQVVKIVHNEQEGYFVPKAVMAELLQYKIEAKYYKEKFENGIKSTEK